MGESPKLQLTNCYLHPLHIQKFKNDDHAVDLYRIRELISFQPRIYGVFRSKKKSSRGTTCVFIVFDKVDVSQLAVVCFSNEFLAIYCKRNTDKIRSRLLNYSYRSLKIE